MRYFDDKRMYLSLSCMLHVTVIVLYWKIYLYCIVLKNLPLWYLLAQPYTIVLSNRLFPLLYTPMARPKLSFGSETDYLGRLIQSYVGGGRILLKFPSWAFDIWSTETMHWCNHTRTELVRAGMTRNLARLKKLKGRIHWYWCRLWRLKIEDWIMIQMLNAFHCSAACPVFREGLQNMSNKISQSTPTHTPIPYHYQTLICVGSNCTFK